MKSSDIKTVLSDRIVIKKLAAPGRQRGFYVPDNARTQRGRNTIWYGRVVKFGLDTNADEAYNLRVGDIVGIDAVGQDCDTKILDDGEFVWVPQEFIALKDDGSLAEMFAEDGEKSSAF